MLKKYGVFRLLCYPSMVLFAVIGLISIVSAQAAETVAVIGTGRVGGALGPRFAELGYTVVYGSRDPSKAKVQELVERTGKGAMASSQSEAAQQGDIVVLAVPGSAVEQTVKGLGNLDGKIIIDVANYLRRRSDGYFEKAVPTSVGELVQSWAPGASVVKAFNTMSYLVMADPSLAGGPVTVPVVGDDENAKKKVQEIIEAMGFETEDLGPILYARHLEGMVVLHLTPLFNDRDGDLFEYYLRMRSD